ncbi:DUF3429 domain-containing protein [Methylobacterium gnaphalii]|uniref:DUF3429 domain-containing protein n=1 Tax=Methylobacterium gnaphalii TaxID=1010610 RepID=A0A512JPP7_9HYPH|nr:DUF3429 domain-containing protein [Methylobacterium gnaphalii]GEP11934.1 hypothetical protein MGN01_37790 [Methylobacterium gnaphalii]GJD70390.1 hypothetical protein MMMDOFMJ_3337 [Methylobacterium gnaphalii]GLS48616.1 hypothetical protein GCM10007885_14600 [Methylobacterium gnaphalii]
MSDGRTITAHEPRTVPWLSVVFGYGPMLPIVGGAALAWWFQGETREALVTLTILWAGAILTFLSGVRRGLSFRTEGGPRLAQIVTMLGLFCLGFLALVAAALDDGSVALALLILGYAAIAVLDPIAAKRGEAPLYFARLRPFQMPIALVGLCALLTLTLRG